MIFNIYNVRGLKVGWVDATDASDALKHAKRLHPGASVERILSDQERRQKQYQDEVEFWEAMRP
jgi:hypothetical protein